MFRQISSRIRLPRNSKDLVHAADLRHGTDGFTSSPKEGVLRIFSPFKKSYSFGRVWTRQHATCRPPKPLSSDADIKLNWIMCAIHDCTYEKRTETSFLVTVYILKSLDFLEDVIGSHMHVPLQWKTGTSVFLVYFSMLFEYNQLTYLLHRAESFLRS
jgi:hypothetical protein